MSRPRSINNFELVIDGIRKRIASSPMRAPLIDSTELRNAVASRRTATFGCCASRSNAVAEAAIGSQ
jgi:hypothetical protein